MSQGQLEPLKEDNGWSQADPNGNVASRRRGTSFIKFFRSSHLNRSSVFRVLATIWVILILAYYAHAAISLLIVLIQNGAQGVTASAITSALLFDQLGSFASQYPLAGIVIFGLAVVLTIIGELTLAGLRSYRREPPGPTQPVPIPSGQPPAYPDERISQVQTWLDQDPNFLFLLIPFIGDRLFSTMRQALGAELRDFDVQHLWQFWLSLGLEVASLFMSVIPLIAVGVGVSQAAH